MFTRDNLAKFERHDIRCAFAAKLKSFSKAMKDEILNAEVKATCVNNEFHWVRDFEIEGMHFVVSHGSNRAKKDASECQRLLDRLLKKDSQEKNTSKSEMSFPIEEQKSILK